MKKLIVLVRQFLFRKDSFYYHAEEVQFEKQAEEARVSYFVAYKKAS